tara:strand:+ start:1409 stop:2746 length:1338 start_codon:yes stop_codon:yes gene_type:complete
MKWDKWQKEILEYKGSLTLCSGRQVGKSTTIGCRAAKLMLKHPKSVSLMIAPSQRQSGELFIKMMSWLMQAHEKQLNKLGNYQDDPKLSNKRNLELRNLWERENGLFAENPTKTTVKLKNGAICYSLPAGKTGIYLRTYSLDFLYIDEAAYVPDTVYTALKPMLAVATKKGLGWECFLSTPFGKGGFFYESHHSDDYKSFHVSSENCERIPREFLKKEKNRLSRIEYAQEYLGEFVDEFHQFFPTNLIKKRMTFIRWTYKEHYNINLKYFLGVDIARYGQDENAFVIAEMQKNKTLKIVSAETTENKNLVETYNRIVATDEIYHFNMIFIDDAGIGAGVTDILIKKLGRKVMGLNNSTKTIDHEHVRKNKIFKEDMYSNASVMLEKDGELDIIDNLKLLKSLKSMTYEYTGDKNLKIYGKYSHLAEAFVRVCWAKHAKSLEIYLY